MTAAAENQSMALVGLGGVGGYIGSLLACRFPQTQLVVRGERGERIRRNGYMLHSDVNGEIPVRPRHVVSSAAHLKDPRIIFICVKNYSLEETCSQLEQAVKPGTVLVPVMNGVSAAEYLKARFPQAIVLDCVIYIIAYLNADDSVTQMDQDCRVNLGVKDADGNAQKQQALRSVYEIMRSAEIPVFLPEDIGAAVWEKFILNCAYNVETAAYGEDIGPLREDPDKAREYSALLAEACAVARAKGIRVADDLQERMYRRFTDVYSYHASSSLQRDLAAGKQTEHAVFSSYILKEARAKGISVPVTKKMDALIQEQVRSIQREQD